MNLAELLSSGWGWAYGCFMALHTLVIITALLVGPRYWCRMLALATVQLDLFLVVLVMAAGSAGVLDDVRLLPCVPLFFPFLAELAALLLVCRWRLAIKSFPVVLRP